MTIHPISMARAYPPSKEARQAQRPEQPAAKAPVQDEYVPSGRAKTCTISTDRVDREIRGLKEKMAKVTQKLRSATDPKEVESLERQLSQLEHELQKKDTNTYRRQQADVY